ncbi:hypothetical protein ACX3P1_18785 [Mesorhizobium sp. A623]
MFMFFAPANRVAATAPQRLDFSRTVAPPGKRQVTLLLHERPKLALSRSAQL